MNPTRRQLLGGLAALGLVAPRRGLSFSAASRVDIAELDLGKGTLSRPSAWRTLLSEMVRSTSVECEPRSVRVKADDPELFEHPFCVLVGDSAFAMPEDAALEQLVQYLSYGGFMVIDDASGGTEPGFDRSVRDLVGRLFPTRSLAALPSDHSVNRAFFLLRSAAARVNTARWLEGVTVGALSPLVYVRNDLSGALERTEGGAWSRACVPGGEAQRKEAVKLGVNLMMYSLTANYKNDQAHIKQLMLERRLE